MRFELQELTVGVGIENRKRICLRMRLCEKRTIEKERTTRDGLLERERERELLFGWLFWLLAFPSLCVAVIKYYRVAVNALGFCVNCCCATLCNLSLCSGFVQFGSWVQQFRILSVPCLREFLRALPPMCATSVVVRSHGNEVCICLTRCIVRVLIKSSNLSSDIWST